MNEASKDSRARTLTEIQNPKFQNIDRVPVQELVEMMNQADAQVAIAVQASTKQISEAISAISASFQAGGRVIYVGAGTSGRIATLDASEILPTFGIANRVIALMAGGPSALVHPREGAEDNVEAAQTDLQEVGIQAADVVIGVASSGSTPYVQGAISYAKTQGALTVSISCVEGSEISQLADHSIEIAVGPELIAGSSRLKAGTAQKMVLNMISTITMIQAGKTYRNLMVDMVASNTKLRARAIWMVQEITGADQEVARAALEEHSWMTKNAVVGIYLGVGKQQAVEKLLAADGILARALGEIS